MRAGHRFRGVGKDLVGVGRDLVGAGREFFLGKLPLILPKRRNASNGSRPEGV